MRGIFAFYAEIQYGHQNWLKIVDSADTLGVKKISTKSLYLTPFLR